MQSQAAQLAQSSSVDSRDKRTLPIFDFDSVDESTGEFLAECDKCELRKNCVHAGQRVTSYRPEKFNGVMLVGEGPGREELTSERPFVGRSGKLLKALCERAGIYFDQCYITNATLGYPPPKPSEKKDKPFHEAFPNAALACRKRLLAEIKAVKPKVIVALGATAHYALTGYYQKIVKRVATPCTNEFCIPAERRIGPAHQCNALRDTGERCGAITLWLGEDGRPRQPTEEEKARHRETPCERCGSKRKQAGIRWVKCPTCGGMKTKPTELAFYAADYRLSEVAGAIFTKQRIKDPLVAEHADYIVSTFHPAFLLYTPDSSKKGMAGQYAAHAVIRHLAKAKRLLKAPPDWSIDLEVLSGPDVSEEQRAADVERLEELLYAFDEPIAVDIETDARSHEETDEGDIVEVEQDARIVYRVSTIKCIGFGTTKGPIAVVDTRHLKPGGEGDPKLFALLDRFFRDPTRKKVGQNFWLYDDPVLRRWGFEIEGYVGDTLVGHHAVYPDEAHKLQHIVFSYTDATPWKPPSKLERKHETFDDLADYNARDVRGTALAGRSLGIAGRGEIDTENCRKHYDNDMLLALIAREMISTGLPVSTESINKVGVETQERMYTSLMAMRTAINDPKFEPSKTVQLRRVLFDPTGPYKLVPASLTPTKLPSTDKAALIAHAGHPFVAELLRWRKEEKLVSTYVTSDGLYVCPDSRVHPAWKITGAKTGRWSSSPNLQNWPRWFRKCIEAPPGFVIIGGDQAQLELRILAGLSGDAELLRRILSSDEKRKLEPDFDLHSFVASKAFGKTFTDLSLKDEAHDKANDRCKCQTCLRKALRELAKTVIYALGYGSGDQTVYDAIYGRGSYNGPPIDVGTISNLRRVILREFRGIPAYQDRLMRQVKEAGEVRSALLGRRRVFPLGEISFTQVVNYPMQSTAADIMGIRMVPFHKALRQVDSDARIIAQVHDALYVLARENRAREVCRLMNEMLSWETALVPDGPVVPFVVSSKAGHNWSEVS